MQNTVCRRWVLTKRCRQVRLDCCDAVVIETDLKFDHRLADISFTRIAVADSMDLDRLNICRLDCMNFFLILVKPGALEVRRNFGQCMPMLATGLCNHVSSKRVTFLERQCGRSYATALHWTSTLLICFNVTVL